MSHFAQIVRSLGSTLISLVLCVSYPVAFLPLEPVPIKPLRLAPTGKLVTTRLPRRLRRRALTC